MGHAEMKTFETDQEAFWAGEFGDDYQERNKGPQWVANNLALFSAILKRTAGVQSVLELGANIGLNLQALRLLLPSAKLSAVEVNAKAVAALQALGGIAIHHASMLQVEDVGTHDFVLIKGVMIHLNQDKLPQVYDLMYRSSSRYICTVEYYNPSPVTLDYRGHAERLYKRDFAGEMMQRFPGLQLVDYGFVYRRDRNFPQDDVTWFLMEKKG
jgi:spore coat polysaccharide biosynthesis protein SpsF